MRRIRNPERYLPAAVVAARLRSLADALESSNDYLAYSLQLWYATEEDVRQSTLAAANKRARLQ